MMILAQIDFEWWHLALVALALVLVKGFEWFKEFLSDRRDREEAVQHTQFLRRIAESNEAKAASIAELGAGLAKEREIREIMHANNLEAMRNLCKYRMPNDGK